MLLSYAGNEIKRQGCRARKKQLLKNEAREEAACIVPGGRLKQAEHMLTAIAVTYVTYRRQVDAGRAHVNSYRRYIRYIPGGRLKQVEFPPIHVPQNG